MRSKGNRTARMLIMVLCVTGIIMTTYAVFGPSAAFKGNLIELKHASTHTPGKVKMTEFVDFYCPHCHMFEQAILPILKKEFGDRLEVTMVGFPVIPNKSSLAFDMYEQAKMMGKGPEMKAVLFRAIHEERVHDLNKVTRLALIKQVGLDPLEFEEGLASGKPAKAVEEGRKLGVRMNVHHTPTIILDGNIKAESIDAENLKTIIQSILERDGAL